MEVRSELVNVFYPNQTYNKNTFLEFIKFLNSEAQAVIPITNRVTFDVGNFIDAKLRIEGGEYCGERTLIIGHIWEKYACDYNEITYKITEITVNNSLFNAVKMCPNAVLGDYDQAVEFIGKYIAERAPEIDA